MGRRGGTGGGPVGTDGGEGGEFLAEVFAVAAGASGFRIGGDEQLGGFPTLKAGIIE